VAGSGDDEGSRRPSAPGWYPDPWRAEGEGERYFDGKAWGTAERPLGRHTSTSDWETPSRSASGRFQRIIAPVLVILLVAGGVVYFKSRSSNNATVTASPATTVRKASAHSSTTVARTATTSRVTTTSDDGRNKSGCGRYCAYTLSGDWPRVEQGDCVNVRVDTNAKDFSFSRVSCQARHDGELYFVKRPDPVTTLSPAPKSIADLIARVCGVEELKTYAPGFAATHPDAISRVGTFGDQRTRACEVRADSPTQSIR
jgi:hypothetical protein